jgi:hypothetical protein
LILSKTGTSQENIKLILHYPARKYKQFDKGLCRSFFPDIWGYFSEVIREILHFFQEKQKNT